jgi:hypothetical protein
MILTLWTGQETAQDARASINAFWVPTRGRPGKETFLGKADQTNPNSGVRLITSAQHQARRATNLTYDAGKWHRSTLEIEDNVLIKLVVQRTSSWNTMKVHASILIYARDEAAHRRFVTPLSGHKDMTFSSHELDGRFDILTFDEAIQLGAALQPFARASFDPVRFNRAVSVHEMEPEQSPRIRLRVRETVNASGETATIVEPERRRGLRIR